MHRLAAAAGVAQRVDRRAGEPRDLGPRHVGHDVERLAQDAGVGDDQSDAERPQAIAQIRDLRALGVERADEQDGLHDDSWAYMFSRSVLIVSSTSQV